MKIRIIAVKVPNYIEKEIYNKLIDGVSVTKKEEIKNYVHLRDKYSSIIGELLVKNILCSEYGYSKIKIRKNKYGKPYIYNLSGIFYNVTHSEEWVVCAINIKNIGIDIEKKRKIDFKKIGKVFKEIEYETILNSSNPNVEFLKFWTVKESYVKLIGKGLSIPLNTFEVKKDYILSENNFFFYKIYYQINGYIVSVCSETDFFCPEIDIKEIKDLY